MNKSYFKITIVQMIVNKFYLKVITEKEYENARALTRALTKPLARLFTDMAGWLKIRDKSH